MTKSPSNVMISLQLALLSLPCWFVGTRFRRQFDSEEPFHAPPENPGTLEALGEAVFLAALTFLVVWWISGRQSRKR